MALSKKEIDEIMTTCDTLSVTHKETVIAMQVEIKSVELNQLRYILEKYLPENKNAAE